MALVVAFALWLEGMDLLRLFLPSPFIIVIGAPFSAVFAVWNRAAFAGAWKDAFSAAPERERREGSARLWGFLEMAFYASGIIAFIAGTMIILSTESTDRLMLKFSIAFLALLWSMMLGMVARILRYRVETR
jgi:flagellar motor component MotA